VKAQFLHIEMYNRYMNIAEINISRKNKEALEPDVPLVNVALDGIAT